MEKFIAQIVQNCLKNDLLSEEDAPWLQYVLEKRISTTLMALIPLHPRPPIQLTETR